MENVNCQEKSSLVLNSRECESVKLHKCVFYILPYIMFQLCKWEMTRTQLS